MAHIEHTALHTIPRRSPFGALFSRTLPRYTGPHAVGVCDIEVPVRRRTFGSFIHKRFCGDGTAGLTMETVLFSMFYPAVEGTGTAAQVVWFPHLKQTIDGFLRMASRTPNLWYRMIAYPLAAAAIWGTTFPAHENADFKRPPPEARPDGSSAPGSWPLVIFSHGVGCSRLMYSAFCGELASRGYVVAALEHRDGTGPASTIRGPDGKTRFLDFINHRDLEWPNFEKQPPDDTTLRHVQLALRLAETSELLSVMKSISQGVPIENYAVTAPHWDWSRWTGAVRMDGSKGEGVVMSGHSLGASLALAAAADKRFAFEKVIAMDPAVQRLEPWRGQVNCPLIVINSEEFAVAPDFMRLDRLADTARDPLIFNIAGGTHPSFSDVHLILPGFINRRIGLSCPPELILSLTISAVAAFLGEGHEQVSAKAQGYITADGNGLGPQRPIGKPGKLLQWINTHRPHIHVPGHGHHEYSHQRRSKSFDRRVRRSLLLEPVKHAVDVTRIELGFRPIMDDEADMKGLKRAGSIMVAHGSPPLHEGGGLLP